LKLEFRGRNRGERRGGGRLGVLNKCPIRVPNKPKGVTLEHWDF